MATIVRRPGKNGQASYRAQVRRKGAPPLLATFTKLSDAKKWGQITEAAILEGRHFTTAEAKRHTLTDLVERYLVEVMPQKRPSTSYTQTRHLYWWRAQLGPHALAAITPATIAECRNQLAQNHAPATVVRYLSTLSHTYTTSYLIVISDQSQVDCDGLLPRWVSKALSNAVAVGFVGDFLANLGPVVLTIGMLHMRSKCSAFAPQMGAAT